MRNEFPRVTPESVGVPSGAVKRLSKGRRVLLPAMAEVMRSSRRRRPLSMPAAMTRAMRRGGWH